MDVEEKKYQLTKLAKKKLKYQARLKSLAFVIGIELLILWLLHPTFFPPLENVMTWLGKLCNLAFWPQSEAEFLTDSYRTHIYSICMTIGELPFFPFLKLLAVWLPPALFVFTLILLGINKAQSSRVTKGRPPRPRRARYTFKKPKLTRNPKPASKKSCMDPHMIKQQLQRLDALKEACSDSRKLIENRDWGLWVRYTENGKEKNTLIPWKNGTIKLEAAGGYIEFTLINGTAHLTTEAGNEPLTKGTPYIFANRSKANQEIISTMVIWLGGNP